jgi:hypothetical protein
MSACCCGSVSKVCELKFPPLWITKEKGSTVKTGSGTQTFNRYRRLSPGEKRSRRGGDHPSPSRVEVREKVELHLYPSLGLRGVLKNECVCTVDCVSNVMARAETTFRFSAKRTSPFKSAGSSVQSTTCRRGVRIRGSNAGYTMFRGSVKSTGYPLHSPVSPSLPNPCVTVCHHFSTGLYK